MMEKLSYQFDVETLLKECNFLIDTHGLESEKNQLSLKHTDTASGNLWHFGLGSFRTEKALSNLSQKDFTILNQELTNTYIEKVYKTISKDYKIGRFRIMALPGQKCMTLHYDATQRIHIPLLTNENCLMIIKDRVYHMPADGSAYFTDTFKRHTALNANWDFLRLHLVFDLL